MMAAYQGIIFSSGRKALDGNGRRRTKGGAKESQSAVMGHSEMLGAATSPEEIERILTSIIIKWLGACGLLVVVLASSALAQTARSNQSSEAVLRQEVKQLGLPGNDVFADVRELARTPAAAARILILQLQVLPHPQDTIVGQGSPQVEHALWSIRALRYITGGLDFCAPTKWKPGRSYEERTRHYWLHFNSKSCVTVFGVWPSRDLTYIAPVDAQRKIIAAWQQWYAREDESYHYKPLVNPESWQWIEGVDNVVEISRTHEHPQTQ